MQIFIQTHILSKNIFVLPLCARINTNVCTLGYHTFEMSEKYFYLDIKIQTLEKH